MSDPRKCCILGICCPPGSAEQRADLKQWALGLLLHDSADELREETEERLEAALDELYNDEEVKKALGDGS